MIHGTRCIPLLRQSTDTDWLSEKRTLRRCRVGGWGGESGEEELSWRSTSTADRFSRDRDDTRIPRSLASAWPRSSGPRSVCSVPMGPHTSLHYTTTIHHTTAYSNNSLWFNCAIGLCKWIALYCSQQPTFATRCYVSCCIVYYSSEPEACFAFSLWNKLFMISV